VAKAFDATLNTLIDAHLTHWAAFLAARARLPLGTVQALDTDLSATLQADRLFRIDAPQPYALHLELESTSRLGIPEQLLRYNVAANAATGLPIQSVLLLLRPRANASDQSGRLEIAIGGRAYLTFEYLVVRIWEETVETLLAAGPGLAPLALLTNEAEADLERAFEQFRDRLQQPDVPRKVAEVLFGATFVLCGLRYDHERINDLYRRLSMTLEDSSTYQWILGVGKAEGIAVGKAEGIAVGKAEGIAVGKAEGIAVGKAEGIAVGKAEGEVQEARRLIIRMGTSRFGQPSPAVSTALTAITDRERLEQIAERLLRANAWEDLLGND
jgi:hypothetical protein